jgi:hypothetical protein
LFQLLGVFHRKKQGKRNKELGFAVGFSQSTSPSHIGASRAFPLAPKPATHECPFGELELRKNYHHKAEVVGEKKGNCAEDFLFSPRLAFFLFFLPGCIER